MSCVAAPATLFPDDMSCFLFPGVHAVYRGCSHRCGATHTHIDGLEHRSHARPPVATLGGMEELGIDPKLITITSLRNMMSGDVSSFPSYSFQLPLMTEPKETQSTRDGLFCLGFLAFTPRQQRSHHGHGLHATTCTPRLSRHNLPSFSTDRAAQAATLSGKTRIMRMTWPC